MTTTQFDDSRRYYWAQKHLVSIGYFEWAYWHRALTNMSTTPFDELRNRDLAAVKTALHGNPALLIVADENGRTPLLFAAADGYLAAVRLAIAELGADTGSLDVVSGRCHLFGGYLRLPSAS